MEYIVIILGHNMDNKIQKKFAVKLWPVYIYWILFSFKGYRFEVEVDVYKRQVWRMERKFRSICE